jgi:hypothetical protein
VRAAALEEPGEVAPAVGRDWMDLDRTLLDADILTGERAFV